VSRPLRLGIFGVGALGFAALLIWGLAGLPAFGDFNGAYGQALAHLAVPERGATSSVAVTTFDFRGIDTLGEEFILFTAAVGILALLRVQRASQETAAEPVRPQQPTAQSRSLRSFATALAPPALVLGIYVVTHGHLTPGGGFQGGVVLMAAFLLIYLAGTNLRHRHPRMRPLDAMELSEGAGAGGFAVIGLGGVVLASAFLENFLPSGTPGNLISGGTIPLLNISVGLEVMGAILVILGELLDQRLLGRGSSS
jgi:multicomponent Na+:H+ antiporter subunit B